MIFYTLGELLMHSRIAGIIVYTKKKNIVEKLNLYINSSRLTSELSRVICDVRIERCLIQNNRSAF